MSPAGRTVPWCCWEEWLMVKDWLLSTSQDHIKKGIQRVEAWRARGRLPLGVDITASLLETALCDSSFWGSAAASAALGTSVISQQQIRLQYSATVVRMVNGIADSQQKGRVAVSVNSLAEAAGLSRLLVDIRHEATHNELPSLATLQLAAKQALDWLVAQYWQRQSEHLSACHARAVDIIAAIASSSKAAAAKGSTAAVAEEDDGDEDADAGEQEKQQQDGGYQAAEGRKHRKLLLSELKGLVPTSHCSLLAALLLQSDVLLPQPAAEQQAAAVQAAEGAAHTAQMAALTSLAKQYPGLKELLLQDAIRLLCSSAACAPKQQQQQQPAADRLLAWVRLLLPAASLISPGASDGTAGSLSTSITGRGKVKLQQQQQQQQKSLLQQHAASFSSACLATLLGSVVSARRQQQLGADALGGGGAGPASPATCLATALTEAQQLLLNALAACSSSNSSMDSASVAASGSRLAPDVAHQPRPGHLQLLHQLCQLATPMAAPANKQQQQQPQLDSQGWLHQQQAALLEAASAQQQLLDNRQQRLVKRPRAGKETAVAAADAAASAAAGGVGGTVSMPGKQQQQQQQARKRWKKAENWSACAIGCLPEVKQAQQLLDILLAPPVHPAAHEQQQEQQQQVWHKQQEQGQKENPLPTAVMDQALGLVTHDEDGIGDAEVAEGECGVLQQIPDAAGAGATPAEGDSGLVTEADWVTLGGMWKLSRQDISSLQKSVRLLL